MKIRDYSKWYTPRKECADLVSLAELTSESTLLEPSAGSGNIIKQVHVRMPHAQVTAVEVSESGLAYLHTMSNVRVIKDDFLNYPITNKFDRIIANPPFTNDIWILHLLKMSEHLNENGILVCIIPVKPIMPYNYWLHDALNEALGIAQLNNNKSIEIFPMQNWANNSDGSFTEIQVIKWIK